MKPFLLLATRADEAVADGEYAGFLRAGSLAPHQLIRKRLEAESMGAIVLDDYSGIVVGGSPFNTSDPIDTKSAVQRRVEAECAELVAEVVDRDFPFFGACYGIGLLTSALGGVVDGTYPEEAGPVQVTLSAQGRADQLFGTLSSNFTAFVGHKEACTVLPAHAVSLASSATCPVQAFRVKSNIYATQFHPELDEEEILRRIWVYREEGYFAPDAYELVVQKIKASVVTEPARVFDAFVKRFG